MRVPLDKDILKDLKEYIILGIPRLYNFKINTRFFRKCLDNVENLYAEDLQSARLQSRPNEIAISLKYLRIDGDGNFIDISPTYKHLIYLGLIHELLHIASRNFGYAGICKDNNIRYGLNEGITQMLAEDIYGMTVSPFSDGYSDFKKIARILRFSCGNASVLNSYFNHTDDLDIACDNFAYDGFYDELNEEITGLYFMKYQFGKNPLLKNIYNERIKILYKKVILNIIIPKISQLESHKSRKEYIREILNSLYDDLEIYEFVKSYLMNYLNMDNNMLEDEKRIINDEIESSIEMGSFVSLFEEDNTSMLKQIFVSRDGKISIIINDKFFEITDTSICEEIYYDLFRNTKSNFNREDVRFLIETIKDGKVLSMYEVSDLNERREQFCALKRLFFDEERMVVLNEYTDADDGLLKIDYIIKKYDGVLDYNEMIKLINKFTLETDENGQDIVRYRDSLHILTDPYLYNCVRASYLFINIANKLRGTTVISDNEIKALYNDITNIMLIDLKVNGNLGINSVRSYASSSNRVAALFVEELFCEPKYYEILYKYISSSSCYKKEQTVKEEFYKSDRYMTIEGDVVRLVNASKRT